MFLSKDNLKLKIIQCKILTRFKSKLEINTGRLDNKIMMRIKCAHVSICFMPHGKFKLREYGLFYKLDLPR